MWLLALWLWLLWCAKNGAEKEEQQQPIHTGSNTGVVATTKVETWGKANTWETVQTISGAESSKYLRGYTWDTVVITKENSGAVVIQPWDELLYRNEVYWFQVKLWKEWKWGKICRVLDQWKWSFLDIIRFFIKHPVKSLSIDTVWCWSDWFESFLQVESDNYSVYNEKKNTLPWPWEPSAWNTLKKSTYGKNNLYYFLVDPMVPDKRIQQLFQYIKCEVVGKDGEYDVVSCPWWMERIFINWFSAFNIK